MNKLPEKRDVRDVARVDHSRDVGDMMRAFARLESTVDGVTYAAQSMAAIGRMMEHVLAPFIAELARALPTPIPCPVCRRDTVSWTDEQRASHWNGHGWMSRKMAEARMRVMW